MAEIRRVFRKKIILIFFIFWCVNGLLFIFAQLSGQGAAEAMRQNKRYREIVQQLAEKPLGEAVDEVEQSLKEGREFVLLKEKLDYLKQYSENVQSIINNAERMRKFSVFQTENLYAKKNIAKTESDFKKVQNLQLSLDLDRVTEAVIHSPYRAYVLFIFMLYVIYDLMKERENGMWEVIHSTKNGRGVFAAWRGIALMLLSAVSYTMLYVSDIAAGCILYGPDDFKNPIQTLETYGKYTALISKGQYLFVYAVISILGVMTIIAVVHLFFVFIPNRNIGVSLIVLFVCLEKYFLEKFPLFQTQKFLKYFNIINLMNWSVSDEEYYNIYFLGQIVSAKYIMIGGLALLLSVSFSFACMIYAFRYVKKSHWSLWDSIQQYQQRVICKIPFWGMEILKSFIYTKEALLAILGIIFIVIVCNKTKVTFPERQKKMDLIYSEYGGENVEGFLTYVNQLQSEVEAKSAEAERLLETKKEKDMDRALTLKNECAEKRKYLDEFLEKTAWKDTIMEKYGIDIYMISDRGYNEILGNNSSLREAVIMIILILLTVLISSNIFGIEKKTGMDIVIKSCKNGRMWIWKRKILVFYSLVTSLFLLIYGYNFLCVLHWYDVQTWGAPVQSLMFIEEPVLISIKGYVILKLLAKYVFLLSSGMWIILFSVIKQIKNRIYIPVLAASFILAYLWYIDLKVQWLVVCILIQAAASIVLFLVSCSKWNESK